MKKVYIRFGKIPSSKKSLNHLTETLERGVSVYEAVDEDGKYKVILPSPTTSSCVGLSGCLERQVYLVEGNLIGEGSDREPLLENCKVVKKINL